MSVSACHGPGAKDGEHTLPMGREILSNAEKTKIARRTVLQGKMCAGVTVEPSEQVGTLPTLPR
jgi:hypothetical protein